MHGESSFPHEKFNIVFIMTCGCRFDACSFLFFLNRHKQPPPKAARQKAEKNRPHSRSFQYNDNVLTKDAYMHKI